MQDYNGKIDALIDDMLERVESNLAKGALEPDPVILASLYSEIMVNLAKTRELLKDLDDEDASNDDRTL